VFYSECLEFGGSKIQVSVLKRTFLQRNKISVPCGSVLGSFHSKIRLWYINLGTVAQHKDRKYVIIDVPASQQYTLA
jgi:hypothetical protein